LRSQAFKKLIFATGEGYGTKKHETCRNLTNKYWMSLWAMGPRFAHGRALPSQLAGDGIGTAILGRQWYDPANTYDGGFLYAHKGH
jgi:hypothetical protein